MSLVGPLGAQDTANSTKVMLARSHVVAAVIAIPLLAGYLNRNARQNAPTERSPNRDGG